MHKYKCIDQFLLYTDIATHDDCCVYEMFAKQQTVV
jgi:hypothetical protein